MSALPPCAHHCHWDCNFVYALPGDAHAGAALPPPTARKTHIRRLNDILHLCIERGDTQRARRAWSILIRCKEYDWTAMWRTGLLLVRDDMARATDTGLEYLRAMMLRYPDEREAILQEKILNLAAQERYRAALDEVEFYLPSFPYQDNDILQCYAGLISLYLAMHDESTDAIEGPTRNEGMLLTSQGHFERAVALDAENTIASTFLQQIADGLPIVTPFRDSTAERDSNGEMDIDEDGTHAHVKRSKHS